MTGTTPICGVCRRPIIGTPMKMGYCADVYHLECTLPPPPVAGPTQWAYDQTCKALHHWRDEARRLGKIAGVEPRGIDQE